MLTYAVFILTTIYNCLSCYYRAMLDLLAVKSLLILMVVGELTVVALLAAKIIPKLIVRLHMLPVG